MRILLTNSPFQYYMTTAFYHPDWVALNLPQLAAMVKPKHEVRIVDNWHYWFKQEGIGRVIRDFKPDVLAISNSTAADTESVLSLVQKIRVQNPNIVIIGGGQAAAVRYRDCLNAGFNLIVMGEGEQTFQEVVERLDAKSRFFADIRGIAYKEKDEERVTPPREIINNLDDLPFPSWELMPKVKSAFFKNIYASVIESSRGCSYACDFCAIQSYWGRTYRKKSNERILAELKYLKFKLGFEQVYFIDDSFALNAKEYTQLFEAMIKEDIRVKGFSQIRPDTVAHNPKMIELAARAGFWGFLVGFDSYNEKELGGVNKSGGETINIKAAQTLRANGIGIFGVHMFGLPNSDPKAFKKTFNLGMEHSDTFRISRFSVIPGTPLFDNLAKQDKVEKRKGQYVPYSHKIRSERKKEAMLNFLYVWYEARSLLGIRALRLFMTSSGIARKLKWRAYVVAARYGVYLALRKIGITIL